MSGFSWPGVLLGLLLGAAGGACVTWWLTGGAEGDSVVVPPVPPPEVPPALAAPSSIRLRNVAREVGLDVVLSREAQPTFQEVLRFRKKMREEGIESELPPYVMGLSGAELREFGPRLLGCGLAVGDYDNDGDDDVYLVVRGGPNERPRNRLFRNDGGRFTDVTDTAGVGDEGSGSAAIFADFTADGWLDLYVTNQGPNTLYHNRGDGTFALVPGAGGALADTNSASAAFGDIDGDGDIDLFVANSSTFSVAEGAPEPHYPFGMIHLPNRLFLNRGDGTFERKVDPWGVERNRHMSLGAVLFDIDLDGDLDLYVANDGDTDELLINEGGALKYGSDRYGLANQQAGMGIAIGDYDGDLFPDLFVTHWYTEMDSLFTNPAQRLTYDDWQHGALFRDDTCRAGLGPQAHLRVAWGTLFLDLDLDGDEDLVVVRGHTGGGPFRSFDMPHGIFENVGGTFRDVSDTSGANAHGTHISRGLAAGDFDGDGDLDLIVANIDGPVELLRNDSARGNGITLRLRMDGGNRFAIGALVTVTAGGRRQLKQIFGGGSYLSGTTTDLVFGLGAATEVEDVAVRWPGRDQEEHFGPLPAGQVHVLSPRRQDGL